MYGLKELKPQILLTDHTVTCPVSGCNHTVQRQRKRFQRSEQFFCPLHQIFISPSTFEYLHEDDNLLWRNEEDKTFLRAVREHKRESRMVRDNSEDALTWNVFRYLELSGELDAILTACTGMEITGSQPVYWSYSHASSSALRELNQSRQEFGEEIRRSSEPDLIIVSKNTVFWIEAKLNAPNNTKPSNPLKLKKYLSGGDAWFTKVFSSDYQAVAVRARRYELTRFWLLGSWMAADMDRKFVLMSLMRNGFEEHVFQQHIHQDSQRVFLNSTWETIYELIKSFPETVDTRRTTFLSYMENKSVGYSGRGSLRPAFPTLSVGT